MYIDYNLKSQIIDCGLSRIYSQFSMACFKLDTMLDNRNYDPFIKGFISIDRKAKMQYLINLIVMLQDEALSRFNVDLTNSNDYLVEETKKINRADYKRGQHLKDKVNSLLKMPCLFLTYTFTNDTLKKYQNVESLRRFVRRHLNSLGCQVRYIANIDYGSKNDRVHYHAIVQTDYIDPTTWSYGALNVKRITNPNSRALGKYISKLTNHAIKDTAKCNRVIYSRYKPDNSYSVNFNNLGLSK